MGFRTYRNNPLTTKCCVGKIGAGVPRPWRAKRAKESRSTGRPAAIKSVPKARKEEVPSNGAPTCHRQIRQRDATCDNPRSDDKEYRRAKNGEYSPHTI